MPQHVSTGTIAPNLAPEYIGQHYIDTATSKHYLAVGTSTAADWIEVNGGNPRYGYSEFTAGGTENVNIGSSPVILTGASLSANLTVNFTVPAVNSRAYRAEIIVQQSGNNNTVDVTVGGSAPSIVNGTLPVNHQSNSYKIEVTAIRSAGGSVISFANIVQV